MGHCYSGPKEQLTEFRTDDSLRIVVPFSGLSCTLVAKFPVITKDGRRARITLEVVCTWMHDDIVPSEMSDLRLQTFEHIVGSLQVLVSKMGYQDLFAMTTSIAEAAKWEVLEAQFLKVASSEARVLRIEA